MNIEQLALQYRQTADDLQERLEVLKWELACARGLEVFKLQKRIETMYAELQDVRTIMGYLNNYYIS